MKRISKRSLFQLAFGLVVVCVLSPSPVAGQPIITTIVPDSAAAGFGQLVTIQGFNLLVPGSTTVTLTPQGGGPSITCAFVFVSPSSANEIYVRFHIAFGFPGGPCTVSPGKYEISVTTTAGVSNPVKFQIKGKPATPVPRRLCNFSLPGCPTITSASVGSQIGIPAYGTDTVLATAVFVQGSTEIPVLLNFGADSPALGEVSVFTVPSGLSPGTALVRLRTAVSTGAPPIPSDLSHALVLVVTP